MANTIKTFKDWTGDLTDYLQVGDLMDDELQDYFNEVLPPIRFGSFTQMGEANTHNEKGKVYSTHYRGLFLGDLNNIQEYPAEAILCLESMKTVAIEHLFLH